MEHAKIHSRPQDELDVYYARRLEDPLEVAYASTEQRQSLMAQDKLATAECLNKKRLVNAVEFMTDYCYRSVGIVGRKETQAVASYGIDILRDQLKNDESLGPRERLRLQMRILDLENVQAFSQYHLTVEEIGGTLADPKEKRTATSTALNLLERQTVSILRQGASLLESAQEKHDALYDDKSRKDMRGQMFELLYMTYARYKLYQDERADEEMVVGATAFEDNAAKYYSPENHNYDVLSLNSAGQTTSLVQCKNYSTDRQYKWPIGKVEARAFGRFVASPQKCIGAICILADNSPDVDERQMVANVNMLEDLFNMEDAPKAVGRKALAGMSA